jgi:phosphoribosyl 1,2-cyclic phosphodiesterase
MTVYEHRDLVLATLGSGSSGNCTYLGTPEVGVLIDAGVSAKAVVARLEAAGLGSARIAAILLTHEHSDHISATERVARRLTSRQGTSPDVVCTDGTGQSLPAALPRTTVTDGDRLIFGPLGVSVHAVPHDAREPVCYAVEHRGARGGVITDLGVLPRSIVGLLSTLDVAVLEFNHDLERLAAGPYPPRLQARIRGPRGHLDNVTAARGLTAGGGRLSHVILGHLSTDNNSPTLALEAAHAALHRVNPRAKIQVAARYEHTGPFAAAALPPEPVERPRATARRPQQLSLF